LPTFKKDHYALTGETVRKALEEDEKKGLIPFMLSENDRSYVFSTRFVD
jgi:hypothetical protein